MVFASLAFFAFFSPPILGGFFLFFLLFASGFCGSCDESSVMTHDEGEGKKKKSQRVPYPISHAAKFATCHDHHHMLMPMHLFHVMRSGGDAFKTLTRAPPPCMKEGHLHIYHRQTSDAWKGHLVPRAQQTCQSHANGMRTNTANGEQAGGGGICK